MNNGISTIGSIPSDILSADDLDESPGDNPTEEAFKAWEDSR